jgi:predicted aspartyl protease
MVKHSVPIEILEIQDGDYHLFITAYAGRNKLRLLIDTGASKTILSKAFCHKTKSLKLQKSEHTAAGLGTADMQSWFTEIKTFRMGTFQMKNYRCGVLDLSHVTELYRRLDLPDFDGVLGCDVLVTHAITIDLKRKQLTIPA